MPSDVGVARTEVNDPPSADTSLAWTPGAVTVSAVFSLVS